MFINYAHRGASAYELENTMEAFRLAVKMGANGIETDVRRTKDGVLVLFHDDSLKRLTGIEGTIQDYTYPELLRIDVSLLGKQGKIPRLSDFLQEFSRQDLYFAIEFKQEFTETNIIDMLSKYDTIHKTVFTSFNLECLMRARLRSQVIHLGYLTNDVNRLTIEVMKTVGISEICPNAKLITPELVSRLHADGFSVRAWGVKTVEQMKSVYDAGADGMTVNFPDLLNDYILEKQQ
jgi:glycerophosphoryl diester phosphodiesterase